MMPGVVLDSQNRFECGFSGSLYAVEILFWLMSSPTTLPIFRTMSAAFLLLV